jgi:uncharacterized cupin superfamily protein
MATGYTLKNLDQVEDSAPKFGFEEVQEARFATRALGSEEAALSYHRLKPGKRSAFAHRHQDAEEIYVVLQGTGRMKLDDDIVDLKAMDAVRVAPTVTRAFEAGDDGLAWIACGAHHEGDGEIVQDWWT